MNIKQIIAIAILFTFTQFATAEKKLILGHELYGSGDEHVLVFHSWMGSGRDYDSVKPWLNTERYTYAFVDVRGYGESKSLDGKFTSDEIAEDTLRLASFLGWEKFHLVAHSMNGMAAYKTILEGEEHIKSLVAITPVTPDGYPASEEDIAFLSSTIDDQAMSNAAFSGLTGGQLNDTWAKYQTSQYRMRSRTSALKGYLQMWLNEDFSSELSKAKIKTPVLVIGGRNDLPGFQEAHYNDTIAKWVPNIRFEYIDNAGHFPMYETPVLLATLIEKHLDAHN